MNRKILLFVLLFSSVWNISNAQVSLTGEFRTRSLVDHGYMIPARENENIDFSIDQRTRLNLGYKTEKYNSKIVFQDARVWGSDDLITKAGMWGSSSGFGLHEAWFDIKLNNVFNVKIGRQEWNYDNMRVLSYRNWATGGLSYDGVLLQARNANNGLSFDLGLSYNNNSNSMKSADNSNWQPEKLKTFNFLHLKKSFNKSSYISILTSLSGKTDTANMAILGVGTHGITVVYNKGKLGGDGLFGAFEGYYQHGTDLKRGSDGNYKNINAYMLLANIGLRTFNKKLEVSAGAELISGHDYSNTGTDYNNTRHSFDLQYGMRFPAYGGNMNHFTIQDSYLTGTKGGGYFDPFLKVKYKISEKGTVEASCFNPILSTKVRAHTQINTETKKSIGAETDESGNPVYWNGSLGQYVDVNYMHKLYKDVVIKAGLSYANVSDIKNQMAFGYEDVANRELYKPGTNYFGWVMIIIRPNFLPGNIKNNN